VFLFPYIEVLNADINTSERIVFSRFLLAVFRTESEDDIQRGVNSISLYRKRWWGGEGYSVLCQSREGKPENPAVVLESRCRADGLDLRAS
jgi:hypothetical protein